MYSLKLIVLSVFAMDKIPRTSIASSNSFISAILVKYIIGYWGSVTPWMIFHWTTLCKCCYCCCQVLWNESEDPQVQMILYSWSQFLWECDECLPTSNMFYCKVGYSILCISQRWNIAMNLSSQTLKIISTINTIVTVGFRWFFVPMKYFVPCTYLK